MFISLDFLSLIHSLTAHSLIEIHIISVEFRSFHTSEAGLSGDGHAACSAHSGTIHHQSIQTDDYRKFQFLTCKGSELHHDHRSDSYSLVILLSFLHYKLFKHCSNKTLEAGRTVISTEIKIITDCLHLFLINNKVFGLGSNDYIYGHLFNIGVTWKMNLTKAAKRLFHISDK